MLYGEEEYYHQSACDLSEGSKNMPTPVPVANVRCYSSRLHSLGIYANGLNPVKSTQQMPFTAVNNKILT